MFIVLLKFSTHRAQAAAHMAAHNAWIQRGFADGVFLLVGSLESGGAVLAHGTSRAELEVRVQEDPFVHEAVVQAEILELKPARVDERLGFLRP